MNENFFIRFPKLGIHLEINPVLFQVGPFSIHWYGVITALAFLVIIIGVLRKSDRYGLKQDDLIDMMLFTVPIGIIGARLFYVLMNWEMYSGNPLDIVKIWEGGLAIYGGIILGIITILLFCRSRKINALQLLDHIVVYLALGQSVGRWGNFVNQELFGPPTTLPWGMTGNIIERTTREPVHPLFLYESLWNLGTFFLLAWFRKRKKLEGEVFSLYMVSYGCARLLIDSMRSDLRIGGVNINQVIGGIFAVAFLILFIYRRLQGVMKGEEAEPVQPSQYRDILEKMEEKPVEPIGQNESQNGETTILSERQRAQDEEALAPSSQLDEQNGEPSAPSEKQGTQDEEPSSPSGLQDVQNNEPVTPSGLQEEQIGEDPEKDGKDIPEA